MTKDSPYKGLELYNLSKKLVAACYELTQSLPPEEKTNISHIIRNAALTTHINVAQGAFVKAKKKKNKYIHKAQTSLIVLDAATEVLVEVGLIKEDQINELISLSSGCYQLLEELLKR